ncbi:hypothetical protein DRQ25_13960 [Candidatus Fermentibacteria bacterium]|nr:MAG: hypothetical protein DRQ25_13960 [Candidatus Fermentibacteria bacterium]
MDSSCSKIKLCSDDWGWVAINIGMGIGAGIVFLPVQAGLVGLWTFLIAVLIAYPALYLFQRLFINTLVEAPECEDYPTIISEYLGKKWGVAIGFLYFVMLIIWVFVYSETITNDSGAYLQTYGLTQSSLSDSYLYSFLIIVLMVFLAFKSKTLLFHISKILVVIILLLIVLLSVLIIQYWDLNNIMAISSYWHMTKNVIVTLPFAMTSILFLQSLSPTITAIRSRSQSIIEARKRTIKIMNTSFAILAVIVFFFALSCTLAVNHTEARQAFINNTSFLAIMAKHIPGTTVPLIGVVISITAVTTSFFGVLLAFYEACVGLSVHLFMKTTPREDVNMNRLSKIIIIFTVLVAWFATIINFPILYFTSICSPIFGIIGCFIPVVLIYRIKSLHKYKNFSVYLIIITGALLVISPIIAFLN